MADLTAVTTAATRMTMGLDLGDAWSRYCLLDADGGVQQKGRAKTTKDALEELLAGRERMRVVIEVGTHARWVSDLIARCGHEVIVANASKMPLIYQSERKNDELDAERLARVARVDAKLLSPVEHRGPEAHADLARLRARDKLVAARSKLLNHVRGAVKAGGARVGSCSAESFHKVAPAAIPQWLQPALTSLRSIIESLTMAIRAVDREIEQLAKKRYPEAARVMAVAGVGPVTGLAFVLTIEDPKRFRTNRMVGSYLGLTPKQSQSSSSDPELHITKRGDRMMRRLLVSSAHYIVGPFGPETDLRRWGLKLAARGGKNAKKRAVVAVARKLATLLLSLWRSGQSYEPLRSPAEPSAGKTSIIRKLAPSTASH